ncbi:uncharacterized protein LOC111076689 [Drosophila obscura]|uniref:uncharacterized protein LOC111076689 n=1 Tax=Drosophila obscura TaxID=7282 RepID=UPI001BB25803|nr:uncharacterized protein LOC111076689 [Drosophila obscura]
MVMMMMDTKTLSLFCVVLAVFACHTFAQSNAGNNTEDCPPENGIPDNNETDKGGVDEGLCVAFQEVRGLIDLEALEALIETHAQCDAKFRKAIRFFNTPAFEEVALQLQASEAYQTALEELQFAGVNTTDIEIILDIFACIALPVPQSEKSCDCSKIKKKSCSFIADLLVLMPKSDVHEYSVDAQSRQSNFALFSRTVTSIDFQATLRANIKKRDLAHPLKTLRRYGWDIPELLRALITILSW